MSKLDELIKKICPNGVEYKSLINVLSQPITDGPHETPVLQESGVPFISVEAIHDGIIDVTKCRGYISKEYSDLCRKKYKPETDDLYMVKSASIGRVAIVGENTDFDIWSPIAAMRPDKSIIIPRFLFHALQTERIQNEVVKKASKSSQPNLSMRVLESFMIPVPPLEIQREIIRVLDDFALLTSELITRLTAELQLRKKQYEYYINTFLTRSDNYPLMMLGEVVTSINSGKNKERNDDGEFPVYGSTGVISKTNRPVYNWQQILVARVGANAGYVHIADGNYDVSDNTLILNVKKEYSLKYVYYLLQNMNLNQYAKGGGQPLITAGELKKMPVLMPPQIDQERVTFILDRFCAIWSDLSSGLPAEIKARQKQYEYYRDRLFSFRELGT